MVGHPLFLLVQTKLHLALEFLNCCLLAAFCYWTYSRLSFLIWPFSHQLPYGHVFPVSDMLVTLILCTSYPVYFLNITALIFLKIKQAALYEDPFQVSALKSWITQLNKWKEVHSSFRWKLFTIKHISFRLPNLSNFIISVSGNSTAIITQMRSQYLIFYSLILFPVNSYKKLKSITP